LGHLRLSFEEEKAKAKRPSLLLLPHHQQAPFFFLESPYLVEGNVSSFS